MQLNFDNIENLNKPLDDIITTIIENNINNDIIYRFYRKYKEDVNNKYNLEEIKDFIKANTSIVIKSIGKKYYKTLIQYYSKDYIRIYIFNSLNTYFFNQYNDYLRRS